MRVLQSVRTRRQALRDDVEKCDRPARGHRQGHRTPHDPIGEERKVDRDEERVERGRLYSTRRRVSSTASIAFIEATTSSMASISSNKLRT